jgi:hypothetical protein
MDAKRVTDWLDLLAAVSVLAGVLLLVQEIRLNTQAVSHQAAVARTAVLSEPFFESAELRAAHEKIRAVDGEASFAMALIDTYGHTPEEALVWSRHLGQIWQIIRADYHNGNEDEAEMWARVLLSAPDNQLFIKHQQFSGEFGEMIQEISSDIQ